MKTETKYLIIQCTGAPDRPWIIPINKNVWGLWWMDNAKFGVTYKDQPTGISGICANAVADPVMYGGFNEVKAIEILTKYIEIVCSSKDAVIEIPPTELKVLVGAVAMPSPVFPKGIGLLPSV